MEGPMRGNNSRRSSTTETNQHNNSSFDVVETSLPNLPISDGGFDTEEESPIRIPIIGFEVMEERARFTVFKLRVENERLNETWLVFRRYTDFERLYAKLKEEFQTLPFSLPPKRWIRDNFETAFLEDRMKGLQAFVDSIMVQRKLTESATVREFFCLDEPPLHPDNAEESRAMYGSLEETIMQLKDALNAKQTEIQILRAQLALVNTQHEHLIKQTKHCHQCGHRMRASLLLSSPLQNCENSSPMASSTPNFPLTPTRNRNTSARSNHSENAMSSSGKVGRPSGSSKSFPANISSKDSSIKSTPPQVPKVKLNGLSNSLASSPSSSNSDFGSVSDPESSNSPPRALKDKRSKNIEHKDSQQIESQANNVEIS